MPLAEASITDTRPARPGPIELCLLGAFAAAIAAYWWLLGVPRPALAPGIDRVDCVSYAPFRQPGETPFDATLQVSRERIQADLRLLSTITDCVRTYSVAQGLDQVPSVARELGMRVLLGAWLGRNRADNASELERAIELARREAPAVQALIVGNEVLLRGELSAHELGELLARANRALDVPVTYADVWEFWLRHPQLSRSVDFVTVHVLPYWEDEPVAVGKAVEHVFAVYRDVQAAFPQHAILLGETGWPRAGRERREAVPGRVEQARFIRTFVDAAAMRHLPYNLIEAFDQPWKRRLEGAMGGYWGLFDREGNATFPWHGPVRADPLWRDGWAGAAGATLAFALVAAIRRRGGRAVLAHALVGAGAGGLLVAQWRHAVLWNEDLSSAMPAAIGGLLTIVYGWLVVERLSSTARGTPALPGVHAMLARLRRGAWSLPQPRLPSRRPDLPLPTAGDALSLLRFAYLFAAAMTVVLLVFDARYRGFPWASFVVPLGAALWLAWRGERLAREAREERALCAVIAVGALLALTQETLANREATGFLLGMLLYAAACLGWVGWLAPRARTSNPSNAPNADKPNE